MHTSSKITFTLPRLLFAYHSTPVSNICHQANPWRENLLLLNCTVSQPGEDIEAIYVTNSLMHPPRRLDQKLASREQ